MFPDPEQPGTYRTQDNIGIYVINQGFTRDLDGKDADGDVEAGCDLSPGIMTGSVHPLASTSNIRNRRCYSKWTFWINVLLLAVVFVLLALCEFGYLPSNKGGFYCNDPKLSFKFHGDTIKASLVIIGGLFIPLFMMLIVELMLYKPERISYSNARCKAALVNSFSWYKEYLLGFIFNIMFMEIAKFIIGEPRPHFFDSCRPDKLETCVTGEYVENYKCTNAPSYTLRDSYKSFPSGHTSLSVFMGVYLFWYLQKRAHQLSPRMFAAILQIGVVAWAIVCSLTRITDHRHHWWDVLGGSFLGIGLGYYAIYICDRFSQTNPLLSRCSNGDSGRSLDNHNSVRQLIITTSDKSEDLNEKLAIS